jgi:hypothetical protein
MEAANATAVAAAVAYKNAKRNSRALNLTVGKGNATGVNSSAADALALSGLAAQRKIAAAGLVRAQAELILATQQLKSDQQLAAMAGAPLLSNGSAVIIEDNTVALTAGSDDSHSVNVSNPSQLGGADPSKQLKKFRVDISR